MQIHAEVILHRSTRVLLALLALGILACVGPFETRGMRYKRYMKCADRVTDANSVGILRPGQFSCDPLPEEVQTPQQAKRFYLQRAWEADPSSPAPPQGIAIALWSEGDYRGALLHFDAVYRRTPQDLSAVVGMVTMYRLLGQYDRAQSWVRWIAGLRGKDARKVSCYLQGRILYELGRYEEASDLLEEAYSRAQAGGFYLAGSVFTMRDVEFYLAQLAIKRGQRERADELFRAWIKRNPDPDLVAYLEIVFGRGVQEQAPLYDEIEACWVHARQ